MDNFKIIYKILKELESHMGDETFSNYEISAEKLHLSYEKWEQLLILMSDKGYINGLVTSSSLSDKYRHLAKPIQPVITVEGLEYLAENSFMQKARRALMMAGEIL